MAGKVKYSECPKSKLVRISDDQILAQFQTVWFLASVQNLNNFIQILDVFDRLKAEKVLGQMVQNVRILDINLKTSKI